MVRPALVLLFAGFSAQTTCLVLHERDVPDSSGERRARSASDAAADAAAREAEGYFDESVLDENGAMCAVLYGDEAGTPFRFMAMTRRSSFVCLEEEAPLFAGPSEGDADCAERCLQTPGCNYYMSWGDESRWCQGSSSCTPTEASDPGSTLSIYRRKRDPLAARLARAVDVNAPRARARLLAFFDFDQQLDVGTTSRSYGHSFADTSGSVVGHLWNAGPADARTAPQWGEGAKFGNYWSFTGTQTGIKVPVTNHLVEYSAGSGATITIVFRKDGYDRHMGRLWSGPNIDLYGYSSGLAINMNGVRCLFPNRHLYDNSWHTIVVTVQFATGSVEVWDGDQSLGNSSFGPPMDEFEYIRTTEPWLIGIRYAYSHLRTYDGDADEWALFSWAFSEKDRQQYLERGAASFVECTDDNTVLTMTVATSLQYSVFSGLSESNVGCVFSTGRTVVASSAGVDEAYVGVRFNEVDGKLAFKFTISVPPCGLADIQARLSPTSHVIDAIDAGIKDGCVELPAGFDFPSCRPNCFPIPEPEVDEPEYFVPKDTHPRVLFTPDDLPVIRERARSSWVAQESRKTLESMIELRNESSRYGQLYQKLLACDLDDFVGYTTVEDLLVNQRNNTEWIGYPDIYTMFMYSGLLAMIDDDNETAAELGTALSCHSALMNDVFVPEENNILNEDCEPALGLAYDYLHNAMTEEQRVPVRWLIANYTYGRVPFGARMAHWEVGANGVGFFDGVVIQALSIEGEPGYNIMVYDNDLKKQRSFYNWGVFESGFTHEGWHYFLFAMEGAGPTLLAAEIRGAGILAATSAKEALTGAFYQLSPWSTGEQVKVFSFADGAGRGTPGRINIFLPIMKRLYPDDAVVDFMYTLQVQHQEDRKMTSDWLLFGSLPSNTTKSSEVASRAGLPLFRFCPDSGRVVMRSDWSEDALSVHFSARMDTYGLQKIHADINSLALFAHRRQWISDTDNAGGMPFNDEFNDFHSTILIDGLGQSGSTKMKTWPSLPGRIVDFQSNFSGQGDHIVWVMGDATLAYSYYARDYACAKTPQENCTAAVGCRWDAGMEVCTKDWATGARAPFSMNTSWKWNGNEAASMRSFAYGKFFNGSDRDLDAESERWREELTVCPIPAKGPCWGGHYNPVRFAYRSVVLMKGAHPYVLVMDDIQAQDEGMHDYNISWQVRPSQYHWSRHTGDTDPSRWEQNHQQVLKSRNNSEAVIGYFNDTGGPELVVRLVGHGAEGPKDDRFVLNSQKGSWTSDGKMQVYGYQTLSAARRTTLPRFKTILYPRRPSDPELETHYTEVGPKEWRLEVVIGTKKDIFVLREHFNGYTVIRQHTRLGYPFADAGGTTQPDRFDSATPRPTRIATPRPTWDLSQLTPSPTPAPTAGGRPRPAPAATPSPTEGSGRATDSPTPSPTTTTPAATPSPTEGGGRATPSPTERAARPTDSPTASPTTTPAPRRR